MSNESRCSISFDNKSVVYPIYQAIMKEDVSCEALDTGYCRINYVTGESSCEIAGRGNGTLEDKEVLDFALADWEKYRKPLEDFYGANLPWAFTTQASVYSKKEKFFERREKEKKTISYLKDLLASKGFLPGSRQYIEAMAVALFWYVQFPSKKSWRIFPPDDRQEVVAQMEELKSLNIYEFAERLLAEGGWNGIFESPSIIQRNEPSSFNFGIVSTSDDAPYYYMRFLFQEAGLKSAYFTYLYYNSVPYKCGNQLNFFRGIGLYLPVLSSRSEE